MSTRYNTGNPIESTDVRDMSDNAKNFDVAINTLNEAWNDRFGVTRTSIEGAVQGLSFFNVGTFAAGYTLTNSRQTLTYNGHEYSWAGTFQKVVAAGSTPTPLGAGGWVDRSDVTLRSELAAPGGGDMTYWQHLNALSSSMTISSRLRKKIYASDYGVTTSTTFEFNRTALQSLIDDSSSNFNTAVFDVSCTISSGLLLRSNLCLVTLKGVTIKMADGIDSAVVFQHPGINATISNVYIEGGIFDGNQVNAPRAQARSAFSFGICDRITMKGVIAQNGAGYGIAFQANPRASNLLYRGSASNIILEDCHALYNGIGNRGESSYHDGYDFKYGRRVLINGCTAIGNYEKGIHARGEQFFVTNCKAINNGAHGFGASTIYTTADGNNLIHCTMYFYNLYSEGSGQHNYSFSEGILGTNETFTVVGSNLISVNPTFSSFHIDAANADLLLSNLQAKGGGEFGMKVVGTGVKTLLVSSFRISDVPTVGLTVSSDVNGSIVFNNVDITAGTYGINTYSTTPIVINGGFIHGDIGPIRVDQKAAIPKVTGVMDTNITYKKGDIISNSSSKITLKLGMENVVLSSSVNINAIQPQIEGREVSLVSSNDVTYQNSSQMQLKTSPTTISDGNVIKFVCINGKWRQI